MSDEKRVEFHAPQMSMQMAVIATITAVAILGGIVYDHAENIGKVEAALGSVEKGVGIVISVMGVKSVVEARAAKSSDEFHRALWTSSVVILCGATLATGGAWPPAVAAGVALGVAAIPLFRDRAPTK